jgi:hypothetical protein
MKTPLPGRCGKQFFLSLLERFSHSSVAIFTVSVQVCEVNAKILV